MGVRPVAAPQLFREPPPGTGKPALARALRGWINCLTQLPRAAASTLLASAGRHEAYKQQEHTKRLRTGLSQTSNACSKQQWCAHWPEAKCMRAPRLKAESSTDNRVQH